MSITIHVLIEDTATGEQWEESWDNYCDWVDEEKAIKEIYTVVDMFNSTRKAIWDTPRAFVSFILEEVKED